MKNTEAKDKWFIQQGNNEHDNIFFSLDARGSHALHARINAKDYFLPSLIPSDRFKALPVHSVTGRFLTDSISPTTFRIALFVH